MPNFSFEAKHKGLVAGVDEVGRGSLAGPVIAAAVILGTSHLSTRLLSEINDSKMLAKQKREYVYNELKLLEDKGTYTSIGKASVEEIDDLNILQASLLAMKRAIEKLAIQPSAVLVDGNQIPKVYMSANSIKKGDSVSFSIAAASIVAKITRDRLMEKLGLLFPQYGWKNNAGYGTLEHRNALANHGVTPHHRKSFAPVAKVLAL
jgi:ribonuclease HII